jgi:hypothetical protein
MALCALLVDAGQIHWTDSALAIANVVLAVATIVIAVGTMIIAIDVPRSIKASNREEENRFYAILDQTYHDLLDCIIDHPHLNEPDLTAKTPDQIVQYNAYAFRVWNFIEAIYDYGKNDEFIHDTWYCILRSEGVKHCDWFCSLPNPQEKFKDEFREYVKKEILPLREKKAAPRSEAVHK